MFFLQFCVRRCSEICSLCNWRKKGTQANSSTKTKLFHDFSMFAYPPGSPRGRHERLKKRTKTAHKKHHENNETIVFSRPRAKPPKKHVKTAKKAPPGGHNDPQERPRRGRERPSPKGGLGADLAPKRLPEPSGEAFGPLGVGFWRLRGSLFEASSFLRSASCGAFRGASASARAQAQGHKPRTAGRKASSHSNKRWRRSAWLLKGGWRCWRSHRQCEE